MNPRMFNQNAGHKYERKFSSASSRTRWHRFHNDRTSFFNMWKTKRLLLNQFDHRTAFHALRANKQSGICAPADSHSKSLQIWSELPAGNARDFGADTAEVLCLAAKGDGISHRRTFAANLTRSGHWIIPLSLLC